VAQANLSRSKPGVLRGLHFHERQADIWVILEGLAWVALVDLRPVIRDARAAPIVERLEMSVGDAVHIPPGVAHGFLARERVALLYLVTNEYDGSDEHGFAWDDPRAAVGWPVETPVLSARDSSNPSLAEAVAAARQRGTLLDAR
jgi:dTDP-4-dehydrorhamnose 3,5-epimerase